MENSTFETDSPDTFAFQPFEEEIPPVVPTFVPRQEADAPVMAPRPPITQRSEVQRPESPRPAPQTRSAIAPPKAPKNQKSGDGSTWTKSQRKADPNAYSDSFVHPDVPIRWFIRPASPALRAWDEGFPARAAKIIGMDAKAERELAKQEAFEAKQAEQNEEPYEPLTGEDRAEEILRRTQQLMQDEVFRGDPELLEFSYENEYGEQITEKLTRSVIWDMLVDFRANDVLEETLVRYEPTDGTVPPYDPNNRIYSIRDLDLSAKKWPHQRSLYAARYGWSSADDAQFRSQTR